MRKRDKTAKVQATPVPETSPPAFVEKEGVNVWNGRFFASLFDEVDASNLALFRIGFAVAFGWHLFSIWNQGLSYLQIVVVIFRNDPCVLLVCKVSKLLRYL